MNQREQEELLVRLDERTAAMQGSINAIHKLLEKGETRMEKHEERIGALERWRSGIVAVGLFVASLIGWKVS